MTTPFRLKLLLTLSLMYCAVHNPVHAGEPEDVIARVGAETITFRELDVTINSSAMIGMTIPGPGTPERTIMRLTLLDKAITADILYLDALDKGVDKNPVVLDDIERFSNAILGSMYKEKYLVGDLPVSDEEIRDFFKKNYEAGAPFTQDVHMAIESILRKQKFKHKLATLRERLRQGVEVEVFGDRLDMSADAERKSSEVVAMAGGVPVTWGQVRQQMTLAGQDNSPAARRERLETFIDSRLMAEKARAAGLDREKSYLRRLKEFTKSKLVNIHRAVLAEEMSPTDDEIREFYKNNRDSIVVDEHRKIQMLMVKTREEAEEIKQKIESGELTFYQAASEYSIDPNAKMNLGELGWVPKGSGFPELDKVTFDLEVGAIGGPVETPAGWHLVTVLDQRDGQFENIEDRETWKKTRRLLVHDIEKRYVTDLRKTTFTVEVYEDVFSRLTQKEVDALKANQAAKAGAGGG